MLANVCNSSEQVYRLKSLKWVKLWSSSAHISSNIFKSDGRESRTLSITCNQLYQVQNVSATWTSTRFVCESWTAHKTLLRFSSSVRFSRSAPVGSFFRGRASVPRVDLSSSGLEHIWNQRMFELKWNLRSETQGKMSCARLSLLPVNLPAVIGQRSEGMGRLV